MLTRPTTAFFLFNFLSSTLLTLTSAQATTTIIAIATLTSTATFLTTSTTTTAPSPQYTNSLTLRTSLLNSTNLYRYQHNATFLSWNTTLASYASSYASQCLWAHSHGPSGENLARGYPDMQSAIEAWGNERALYTFEPPQNITGFSEATGHFTQLVWKNTLTVGCGVFECNGMNGIGGWLLVCEYWPPGNIASTGKNVDEYYLENVQSQVVQGSGGFNGYAATAGATGENATATAKASASASASASATSSGAGTAGVLVAPALLWRVVSCGVSVVAVGAFVL